MRRTTGALAVATALLLAGCTAEPQDVARTGPESPSPAPASPTGEPTAADPAALDFGGVTGATVPGCRPARTYLALGQNVKVLREVRLDAPSVLGGGRLVGDAFIAPGRAGRNNGMTSIGDRPRFGALTRQPAWDEREVLDGQLVEPGTYVVFLRLGARPGRDVEGVDFPWSDEATSGSDVLGVTLEYARRCG